MAPGGLHVRNADGVARGDWQHDAAQQPAIAELDRLHAALLEAVNNDTLPQYNSGGWAGSAPQIVAPAPRVSVTGFARSDLDYLIDGLARVLPAAAASAVLAHGAAGERAAGKYGEMGMTAEDIAPCLGEVWRDA